MVDTNSNLNGGTPEGTAETTPPAEGGFLSIAEAVAEQMRDPTPETPPASAPPAEDPGQSHVPDIQQPQTPDPFADPGPGLAPDQLAPPHSRPAQELEPVTPEPTPEDPGYLFEHEGQKVTLEEARRGFLREADYSRKTMELADQRRAVETEAQGLQQERQLYAQALQTLKTSVAAQSQGQTLPDDEMARLQTEDPVTWMQHREMQREHQEKLQQIEAEQQRVYEEQQAVQEKQFRSYVEEQEKQLVLNVPDWKDTKVANQRREEMREYLKSYDFSDQEMSQIYDSRLIRILMDAVRGRTLSNPDALESKKVVAQPAPTVRASARPANAGQPRPDARIRQAEKRLNQSNSLEDAVALQLARQEQRTH